MLREWIRNVPDSLLEEIIRRAGPGTIRDLAHVEWAHRQGGWAGVAVTQTRMLWRAAFCSLQAVWSQAVLGG